MGRNRGNGKALAAYLMSSPSNDNVKIFDIRNTANPQDIYSSLLEMSLSAELTKTTKGLYHLQLNPAYGEDRKMTAEDWIKAAEILEKETGFEEQKRVMVLHEKEGRIHMHLVYERYSSKLGKMIPDSYSRLAQDRARKEMEIVFGHRRTPHRNWNRPQIKVELSRLWGETTNARDFISKALEQGYKIVSSQSRRPYMVVDKDGRSHDLVRQLKGVRTREVKALFEGVKLEKDKVVIKRIRDNMSQRNIDDAQENALDKILEQKSKYDARQDELLMFKEKFNVMQLNSGSITYDHSKNEITKSQTRLEKLKANHLMKQFREDSNLINEPKKNETALEKALRELKDVMQKSDIRQRQLSLNL